MQFSLIIFGGAVLLPALLLGLAFWRPKWRETIAIIVSLISLVGIVAPVFLGQIVEIPGNADWVAPLRNVREQLAIPAYQTIFSLLILAAYIGFVSKTDTPPNKDIAPKVIKIAFGVIGVAFFVLKEDMAFLMFILMVVLLNSALIYLAQKNRDHRIFILPILLNALWLFGPAMFNDVHGVQVNAKIATIVASLRDDLSIWYWIPIVLSFITFVCFVISPASKAKGEKGKEAESKAGDTFTALFSQQTSVWLAFGGTLTLVALWLISFFVQTSVAVSGSEALLEAIKHTSSQLAFDSSQLSNSVADWQSSNYARSGRYGISYLLLDPQNPLSSDGARKDDISTKLELIEQHVIDLGVHINEFSRLVPTFSRMRQLTGSLHIQHQVYALQQISLTLPAIHATVVDFKLVYSPTKLITAYSSEELAQVNALGDSLNEVAGNLQKAGQLLATDRSTAQLIITALLLVFLLYPWLLYIAFVASKRGNATRNNRKTLEELGLLDRAMSINTDDKDIVGVQNVRRIVQSLSKGGASASQKEMEAAAKNIHTALKNVSDLRFQGSYTEDMNLSQLTQYIQHVGETADEIILERRSFYSREYVLPLVMMTLLTAVGWFYIFFPNTQSGLVDLIVLGPTAENIAWYLTLSMTPITMGFAGGWILTTVTLAMRWFQDDLFPRSYLSAALRLTFSFLVGIIFVRIMQPQSQNNFFLMAAFVVGIFPLEFVLAAVQAVKKGFNTLTSDGTLSLSMPIPDWSVKLPLTDLTELTFWDDARLYTEGILNIQGLATADLERLVLNTPFAPQQLMSWIDQALLRVHASNLWYPWFTQANFTTATQLLRFCDPSLDTGKPDEEAEKKQLAVVINLVNKAPKDRVASDALPSQVLQSINDFSNATTALQSKTQALTALSENKELKTKAEMQSKLDAAQKELIAALKNLDSRYDSLLAPLQRVGRTYAVEDVVYDLQESRKTQQTLATALAALPDKWKDLAELIDDESRKKLKESLQPTLADVSLYADKATSALQKVIWVVRPHSLDAETLQVILDSLRKNPNVGHLLCFWRNRLSDTKKQ